MRRLFLNHISSLDWLIALEFGRVDEGQPSDCWRGVNDHVGFLHDGPAGEEVGFKVLDLSSLDLDDEESAELWTGPRFTAPALGLAAATAAEIITAHRALFGDVDSVNRWYFSAAIAAESTVEALGHWLACLGAGDSMAHYGLGYTLLELGRDAEAYRHLRHYTEIAPCNPWAWSYFGRAAEARGETAEARAAYERAIELEDGGREESDARELLAELDAS